MQKIGIHVQEGDALETPADVLVLKYAQKLYGLDEYVVSLMEASGKKVHDQLPAEGETMMMDKTGTMVPDHLLFVGVPPLRQFRYKEIREFCRDALCALGEKAPDTKRALLTLHGVGYGLDEDEVFEAQLAGLMDAAQEGTLPPALEDITFVERSSKRARRLQDSLQRILPEEELYSQPKTKKESLTVGTMDRLRTAGYFSDQKKHVFVAMPFAPDFEDTFHYGIRGAARATGFLVERADKEAITGDILDWVKERIESATYVIADLSGANANVYLEVGYAWGREKRTILLIQNPDDLKFNVQQQKVIVYNSISDLEQKLTKEIQRLEEV
jgi:hypothetical protein